MRYIVPAAVFLLMILVGTSPGAPLMTRNIAWRGFDMHLAAGYQVWRGLLTPIMLPVVVWMAGLLHGLTIWIPPRHVLAQIAENQFVPLVLGLALARWLPSFSTKALPWMNWIGNAVLTIRIAALQWVMREALKGLLTWGLPVGAVLLALGSVQAIRMAVSKADPMVRRTLALRNANRRVGLAVLLSGEFLRVKGALPAIAAYAVLSPFVMGGLGWASGFRGEGGRPYREKAHS